MPTPNNRAAESEGKDKFVINPSRTSSQDLFLYEFLGILMGVCIRTGVHLTLDLPAVFWKPLVGQRMGFEDLMEIDVGFCRLLEFVSTCS